MDNTTVAVVADLADGDIDNPTALFCWIADNTVQMTKKGNILGVVSLLAFVVVLIFVLPLKKN